MNFLTVIPTTCVRALMGQGFFLLSFRECGMESVAFGFDLECQSVLWAKWLWTGSASIWVWYVSQSSCNLKPWFVHIVILEDGVKHLKAGGKKGVFGHLWSVLKCNCDILFSSFAHFPAMKPEVSSTSHCNVLPTMTSKAIMSTRDGLKLWEEQCSLLFMLIITNILLQL